MLVNYFDRVNLSVSHAALYTAFGISNVTFGYLSGAYNWTYAACQLPIGVILDRFGVKRVGRISSFIWSVASFAAAISTSVGALFGARFLLGVGEAPTFPASAKAVGRWFPPNERGTATALFDGAAKFASAIGVPALGIILLSVGWRWSFALTGIISLTYFALFCAIYRDPDDDPLLTTEERLHMLEGVEAAKLKEHETTQSSSLGYLLRQKKVLGLAIGFGSYNYVFYLLLTWLPSYLSSALHIDLLHSFLYTGVPWLIATIMDFLGGGIADALIQRGYEGNKVRKTIMMLGMMGGLGILGAAFAHTATQALFWISVSIGGLSAMAPVGWSVPSLIAPHGSTGTVGGIMNLSNQISGISAPIITGYVVSITQSYFWAFAVAAIYLLIGIACYIFLLQKIEAVPPDPKLAA